MVKTKQKKSVKKEERKKGVEWQGRKTLWTWSQSLVTPHHSLAPTPSLGKHYSHFLKKLDPINTDAKRTGT